MIKRTIHHENIAILNVYEPNNRAAKYVKQKLTELKGEINKSIIIAEGPLSISRTVRQKINQEYKKTQQEYQSTGSK